MRRIAALMLAVVILLVAVPAALAHDSIEGCVTDANGNPWTHGGTITCTRLGIVVGSGAFGADGCYDVSIGNGPKVTCRFDFNEGPSGDPADQFCVVPTDNNYFPAAWTECDITTGTGPNAVTMVNSPVAAASPAAGWLLLPAALAAGAFAWRRLRGQ